MGALGEHFLPLIQFPFVHFPFLQFFTEFFGPVLLGAGHEDLASALGALA
jgi:hypothetical protein